MSQILRIVENPVDVSHEARARYPEINKHGVVEQIDVRIDQDGYHVHLDRTLWTRNKRRRADDQREHLIVTETVVELTGLQAARLVDQLAYVLLHVDGRGPKKEES